MAVLEDDGSCLMMAVRWDDGRSLGRWPFSGMMDSMELRSMELSSTLAPYFRDGRLVAVPRRRAARLAVLDLLASEFEPGHRYSEETVNSVLSRYNPDFCTLRRYLVDEDFMAREDGAYWRVGGTVEVD
jgi:hypothetical protein